MSPWHWQLLSSWKLHLQAARHGCLPFFTILFLGGKNKTNKNFIEERKIRKTSLASRLDAVNFNNIHISITFRPLFHRSREEHPRHRRLRFYLAVDVFHPAAMAMGAHPPVRAPFFLFFFFFFFFSPAAGAPPSDTDALLKFKTSLSIPSDMLASWTPNGAPCHGDYANWVGVICVSGKVWGLQLENMNLSGDIDIDALLPMPYLRALSFMRNKLEGPIPPFKKLGYLKSLFLSDNQFSGEIPDDAFSGMMSLKKLHLSNNQFSGSIPSSLTRAPRLLELWLDGNQFSGKIPNFQQKDLNVFNASNNQLEGPIPSRLSSFSPTSFLPNKDLCGKPLDVSCRPPGSRPSLLKIAMLVVCLLLLLVAILALFLVFRLQRKSQTPQLGRANSAYNDASRSGAIVAAAGTIQKPSGGERQASLTRRNSRKAELAASGNSSNKLLFVREDRPRFDLQDLLRASAEVLGSGNFGSSYKAALVDRQVMVVKRFKHMNNVGREEFHEHMRRLGRLSHPNLLPLVAYYYRKEEKLLVFDFVHNGSLASHLHGNHKPGLDWRRRLKIVKGVASGLLYLHSELASLIVPHGHLKSSNVLLNESFDPLMMDYTLVPVVNLEHAQQIMVAYRSPEYTRNGRTTKKTDVWSLGIVILEILTGKFPSYYLAQGTANIGANLASWVDSIARERQNAAQLFDKGMARPSSSEAEMMKLFEIGMACCEEDVAKRWDLKQVVEKIEEVKEMS
ncbi:pollen receptor-like kinase 1 [Diospyros lotus]|uniref:pollen receptor-like kinase 1 n=1 Tax=Diospyros lotus TaxID=55363 RepID=UPI002258C737|nr:pollen receptor-like kinase 1 [Diospyros lotus]